jgi:hypothetical protein
MVGRVTTKRNHKIAVSSTAQVKLHFSFFLLFPRFIIFEDVLFIYITRFLRYVENKRLGVFHY